MADVCGFDFEQEWQNAFVSPPPKITLEMHGQVKDGSSLGFKNQGSRIQIAAARTCYSPDLVHYEKVTPKQVSAIGESTYFAGHHTIMQHAHFTFGMEGVSRQLLWSLLHAHPFYNSEQQSQRYTRASKGTELVPRFSTEQAQSVYEQGIDYAYESFFTLKEMLTPVAAREFFIRFPAREAYSKDPGRNELAAKKARQNNLDVEKKAEEIARYALPIAKGADLYHTLSSLSLARIYRVANLPDSSLEARLILKKMISEVQKVEPEIVSLLESDLAQDDLLENRLLKTGKRGMDLLNQADAFVREFDSKLLPDKKTSLIEWNLNAEQNVANAVREMLGLLSSDLSDDDAIKIILHPEKNQQLADTLFLGHTTKLSRALNIPNYSWKMRISHAADSQEQRHRMSPGTRPILECTVPSFPDYEVPALIRVSPDNIKEFYQNRMQGIWYFRNRLVEMGESIELANLLLPNAVTTRYTESSNLLNLLPKFSKRSCLNAQEEVWAATIEQIQDVQRVHPRLGEFLGPPCESRYLAGIKPFCPEGSRYCGIPAWNARKGDIKANVIYMTAVRTI